MTRYPFVLGLVWLGVREYELTLRFDGSVSARCLATGTVIPGYSLHEVAPWLRDAREGSA